MANLIQKTLTGHGLIIVRDSADMETLNILMEAVLTKGIPYMARCTLTRQGWLLYGIDLFCDDNKFYKRGAFVSYLPSSNEGNLKAFKECLESMTVEDAISHIAATPNPKQWSAEKINPYLACLEVLKRVNG